MVCFASLSRMSPPISVAFAHLLGNYEFHTSNYVLLVYDHFLTFGEEVEKMWKRPFTFPTLLFFTNRYVTHFQYIIIQVAFHETTWSESVCNRYVRFAGASTTALVAVAELILILRVYALYLGNKIILVFLLCLLAGQVIVSSWAVHNGKRVPQPESFPGCVLTGKSSFFAALWGAPLVTDSFIFLLTLWRTVTFMHRHGRTTVMQTLLRDGILYYFVIFGVNLMNTLIYFLAFSDLKAVGASFSQILTSIMISRLHLNLRQTVPNDNTTSHRMQPISDVRPPSTLVFSTVVAFSDKSFFTLGNLGEEMNGTFFDSPTDDAENATITQAMQCP